MMDASEEGRSKECVKVSVNVRPLITTELLNGCTDCVTFFPGEPQVQIGTHAFTYDHVYGSSGSPSSLIFEECIAPLVDALFDGYNATVLAYGQTGSGKTYTMGTNYNGEGNSDGIIPQVMDMIYKKIDELKEATEFLVRVSFIEIFKEEVFDLLDPHTNASMKAEALTSHSRPSRPPIHIRETPNGGITLAGIMEAEVRSKEEMSLYLARGSISRATASTNMNSQSSRSHAIFTICLEQKKNDNFSGGVTSKEVGADILVAKLHLVDLAGSERAKRTGADGLRFKEGVHINMGLLALGNVISALGDEKKRKEGGHVPYRDSKLTRLLQDSLGGNSKTVMIACISPADTNAEETINTLKYANRARNIQNKAVINRDPVAAEMQRMRSQLEQLQSELLFCRGGGAPLEELEILHRRIYLLETKNMELHQELKEHQITCGRLSQHAVDAQVEKDKLILKIEAVRNGKSMAEIDHMDDIQDLDLLKNYVSKIQQLERELLQAKKLASTKRTGFRDCFVEEKFLSSLDYVESDCDGKALDDPSEAEEDEEEHEHSSLQDRLDKELQELNKRLEQKEAEMKQFSKTDTSVLKQHYENKVIELEQEKKALQKEIEHLRFNLVNMSSTPDDGAQKMKEDYLQKLNILEAQVSELKKKQETQSQQLRHKQKSDESAKRLQDEIQKIKSQKVQLQHKIKQESEQFRAWKATREKEVLQLKKEGRRNEYEMHKLMALNQRQNMVLQRKREEASLATKRLKEVLDAKKASSRDLNVYGNANVPGIKALMQSTEHELEVTVRVHEVRSQYERQIQERAAMAKEVSRLKEESRFFKQKNMSDCCHTMSPSARNSRIVALENMLATSSTTLVSMASQLSEAEESERVFSGRGRWNQVRSLAEAKNLMNYLFNLASSSRCQLRDKEINCREKDSAISELKEKVVRLNGVRQLEAKLAQKRDQELQRLAAMTSSNGVAGSFGTNVSCSRDDEHVYALRKAPRTSQVFSQSRSNAEWSDDMDISDSETDIDEEWVNSGKKTVKKRPRSTAVRGSKSSTSETSSGETKANFEISKFKSCCCSCSKFSSCKTKKCECRAAGGICGTSCGCISLKCVNRFINNDILSNSEMAESTRSSSFETEEDEKSKELVAHGAMLLRSALDERPSMEALSMQANYVQQRKPLSDIGNTANNPNVPKPPRRKNWRKSKIQLVPAQDSAVRTIEQERGDDVPLRLPRAMVLTPLDSDPLFGERSSIRNDETASNNKDNGGGISLPRSPLRLRRTSDEKENHMR